MAAPAPKIQIGQITIDGTTLKDKHTSINNHDLVEFNIADFKGYKYCKLAICAIDYTNVDEEEGSTVQVKSTQGGGVIPLGTIKIGS